jgi:stage III sporulation protein AH
MNTKRQTVWLVSMLSLMVVLSAYYLFTEDASKMDVTSNNEMLQDVKVSTKEIGLPVNGAQTTVDQALKAAEAAKNGKTDASSTSTSSTAQTSKETSKDTTSAASKATTGTTTGTTIGTTSKDAQTLKVLEQTKTGAEFFASEQMKRNEGLQMQAEKLLTIITDDKQKTADLNLALEQYQKLEEKEAKVNNIEDMLGREFPNVILTEDQNKWKVIVQSNKLEKSQAVSIIDLVMKEFNVGGEKVSVQFVP